MKLRKNFLPNNLADWSSFLFMVIVIPLFYWFEMFVVLPDFYDNSSAWYWLHFLFGTFIMTNVTSNLLAVMFVDTSVFSVSTPLEKCYSWRYCGCCESPVPPRCWHCNTCNRCILKRDHHCTFSGCCIGHFNHRFFIMFLSYFFVGCCYSLYFNAYFIFTRVSLSLNSLFQVVFPVMFLLLGIDKTMNHCLTMMLVLNAVGLVISGLLLHFHLRLLYRGTVSYEYTKNNFQYNVGLKENIVNTLGTRWYVAWISPFINSPLARNGVDWDYLKTK